MFLCTIRPFFLGILAAQLLLCAIDAVLRVLLTLRVRQALAALTGAPTVEQAVACVVCVHYSRLGRAGFYVWLVANWWRFALRRLTGRVPVHQIALNLFEPEEP